MPTRTFLLSLVTLLLGAGAPAYAEVTAEKSEGGYVIKCDGEPFAEYLTKSQAKPIVWPIIGPGGQKMTRDFPMLKTRGEKWDHGHHRSLWFTHGEVNGVDFWAEGRGRGTIEHREFTEVTSGDVVVIATVNDWVDADGKKHLEDFRRLTFHCDGNVRIIDFDITLHAAYGPVHFGDTKEGTMGLRIPTVMDLNSRKGGRIVNSAGQEDGATWGQAAAWCDYHGPVDDQVVGVAIFNHPSSFRYPTHWHVRDYGLFAANPFGLHDFQRTEEKIGELNLEEGESVSLLYRFYFHLGDEQEGGVAAAFEAYAQEDRVAPGPVAEAAQGE